MYKNRPFFKFHWLKNEAVTWPFMTFKITARPHEFEGLFRVRNVEHVLIFDAVTTRLLYLITISIINKNEQLLNTLKIFSNTEVAYPAYGWSNNPLANPSTRYNWMVGVYNKRWRRRPWWQRGSDMQSSGGLGRSHPDGRLVYGELPAC